MKLHRTLKPDARARADQLIGLACQIRSRDWVVLGTDGDLRFAVDTAANEPVVRGLLPGTVACQAAVGSKIAVATLLHDLGVEQPAWGIARSSEDIDHTAATLGWPVMVKIDRSESGMGTALLGSASQQPFPRGTAGPFLVEQFLDGSLTSIDLVVVDGRVAIAPYSLVLATLGPFGISIESQYSSLLDDRLASNLERLDAGLGGTRFGNVSAIRRPDGSHAVFEVDVRPNVWHAYLERLGYPLRETLRSIHLGTPPPNSRREVTTTRVANLTRAFKSGIRHDYRHLTALLDPRTTWRFAMRGDVRLSYREAREKYVLDEGRAPRVVHNGHLSDGRRLHRRPGVVFVGLRRGVPWDAHAWLVGSTGTILGAQAGADFTPVSAFRPPHARGTG